MGVVLETVSVLSRSKLGLTPLRPFCTVVARVGRGLGAGPSGHAQFTAGRDDSLIASVNIIGIGVGARAGLSATTGPCSCYRGIYSCDGKE